MPIIVVYSIVDFFVVDFYAEKKKKLIYKRMNSKYSMILFKTQITWALRAQISACITTQYALKLRTLNCVVDSKLI